MIKTISQTITELADDLLLHNLRLATAESCTGGLIANVLTDLPGSSQWFEGGLVAYSNAVKIEILRVPESIVLTKGAVSQECVQAMAQGVASIFKVPVALAVSGVAGPGGGSKDKPVGTVCIAWLLSDRLWSQKFLFSGDRWAIKEKCTQVALEELLRLIKKRRI